MTALIPGSGHLTLSKCRCVCIYVLLIVIAQCSGGWIDPDTQMSEKFRKSFVDDRDYELVFSDEFNTEGRQFHDGKDSRWTAMDKNDYTNFALHYYKADLAKTSNGFLNISTIIEDISFSIPGPVGTNTKSSKTKNYQSGMINGWNKFCFTGGMVEISAQLPGLPDAGGLWPAMWLLGNLARATYVGSSNNVWPWSYDTCSKDLQREQAISACNEVNHYGLHPLQGRGAPEIDLLEAMSGTGEPLPGTNVTRKPYFSTSFQVAPSIQTYEDGIIYGDKNKTDINVFFYGLTLEVR
jgi:beta-glucan synthesis-associated protein KRE6